VKELIYDILIMARRPFNVIHFNKDKILELPKWGREYKRIYQQLYYRIQRGTISAEDYQLFKDMRYDIMPPVRGQYQKYNFNVGSIMQSPPEPRTKKLNKPVIVRMSGWED
jgi:hypothetical protein